MAISTVSSNIRKSSSSIEVYRGQSQDIEYEIVQAQDGECGEELSPVDLTGSSIYLTVRTEPSSPTALIEKNSSNALDIEIPTPVEDGIVIVHFSSDDTKDLEANEYVFDVWLQLSSGKRVPVIEVSEFVVKEPVTKIS